MAFNNAGIVGFTGDLADESVRRVAFGSMPAVCPGVTDTPMSAAMGEDQAEAMKEIMRDQPIGRKGRADEIAAAAL